MRRGYPTTALVFLFTLVLPAGVQAGANAGFNAQLGGLQRIENPAVGATITVPVNLTGTTEIKGVLVRLHYNPNLVAFRGFTIGPLLPDAVGPVAEPVLRDDGRATIEGGVVLLGGGLTHRTRGGQMGVFDFEVITEIPDNGTHISLVYAEVNTSTGEADRDVLVVPPRERAVQLVRVFPNPIFNVVVERAYQGAQIRWNTRLPGFNDVGRYRLRGATGGFTEVFSSLRQRFNDTHYDALALIRQRGVDLATTTDAALVELFRAELGLPEVTGDESFHQIVARVRELDELLRTRSHLVEFADLQPATEYEFELFSISLDGRQSQVHRGFFNTRSEPDLRPLFVDAFDLQVGQTGAAISFSTNRPVVTTYRVTRLEDGQVSAQDTVSRDGETRTRLVVDRLEPGVEYQVQLLSTIVGAQQLIAAGMPATDVSRRLERRFRTHQAKRPIRLQGPPVKIVGADRANIVFEVNQPVEAFVDYGLVGDDEAPGALPETLYSWSQESLGTLTRHNLTLSNLDPQALFRYQITLVSPEGDTFSTTPRGNFQWSRDLRFRTAASADTLPPAVIRGPIVDIRDVLAIVRFATDVPTSATIYVGTEGDTYNTDNEFEFTDLTPNGERRFANQHSVIVAGLTAGKTYRYRLEVTSTNGKVTTLEPSLGKGKRLGVHQPPGGAGSFTTSNDPDTQFPVILSGPTVSSKTHETAVIEWTTDEPADSDVQFGVAAVDESSESSALGETSHKMVLSNLVAGTAYTYLVGSTDASGNGAALSSPAIFTTDPEVDLTAPQIVGTPGVVYKNDESATIAWTTDEDATGEVAFGTAQDDLSFIRTLPSTDQTHEVTLTNLTAATTYFYRVASEDLSNNGPTTSATLSFATDAEADVTAPVISDVVVAAGDSTAIVTWTTDEPADSFIDFGVVTGILDLTTGQAQDVTAHEITLTNLAPGQTYFYTVGSIDGAGNGPTKSTEASFTTLSSADVTAPATPTGLAGTPGSQQVVLSWSTNTELDLAGYNVYRRATQTDSFAAVVTRLTGTAYTDAGLSNGIEYQYRITAIDRRTPPNESAPTAAVGVTPTLSASPTTPTSLSVGGQALLPTFTFTNAEPFTTGATLTYTIQVSTLADFTNVTASASDVAQGTGTTSWTIDRELVDGLIYYWRVRAVEGSLSGPFTEAQQFTAAAETAVPGDFDDSGAIDLIDFFLFADAYGKPAADFALYDLDNSGAATAIDLVDFFVFADAYSAGAGKAAGGLTFAHRVERRGRIELQAIDGQRGAAGPPAGEVRLRVVARDMEPLRAYGVALTWDPAALTFAGAVEGPGPLLESRGGDAGLFRVLDQRPGRVVVVNGLVAGAPVDGDGLLAEMTFRVRDRQLAATTRFTVEQALVAVDAGDVRRVTGVAPAQLLPAAFALGQAYPNPFNPSTQIDFALAAEVPARLVVYDVLGRTVRALVHADEALAPGYYSVSWDGRDGSGRPAGSGLYFYRLETPSFTQAGRMLLLK